MSWLAEAKAMASRFQNFHGVGVDSDVLAGRGEGDGECKTADDPERVRPQGHAAEQQGADQQCDLPQECPAELAPQPQWQGVAVHQR